MFIAADLYFAFMIFAWAILLGYVNVENKLYVFMVLWIVFTYMFAPLKAVHLVVVYMAWALLATMFLDVWSGWCIAARIWLDDVEHEAALTRCVRRSTELAAAA
jgi:hypothetical protein